MRTRQVEIWINLSKLDLVLATCAIDVKVDCAGRAVIDEMLCLGFGIGSFDEFRLVDQAHAQAGKQLVVQKELVAAIAEIGDGVDVVAIFERRIEDKAIIAIAASQRIVAKPAIDEVGF